jgi:HK97 gp10 family phage protein
MKIDAEMKGLDKALKKMKRYPEEKKAGVVNVIEKTSNNVEASQKQDVPVGEGETKDSIQTIIEADGLTARIGPMGPKGFKKHWLEFGTVKMPAQPFIRPSGEKNRNQYISDLKKEMSKVK